MYSLFKPGSDFSAALTIGICNRTIGSRASVQSKSGKGQPYKISKLFNPLHTLQDA
jgi:hypothetical protein